MSSSMRCDGAMPRQYKTRSRPISSKKAILPSLINSRRCSRRTSRPPGMPMMATVMAAGLSSVFSTTTWSSVASPATTVVSTSDVVIVTGGEAAEGGSGVVYDTCAENGIDADASDDVMVTSNSWSLDSLSSGRTLLPSNDSAPCESLSNLMVSTMRPSTRSAISPVPLGAARRTSYCTMALRARTVACVEPKRPFWQRDTSHSIAFSVLAANLVSSFSHTRTAIDVVSVSSDSPPEHVIEPSAPGSAPDSA
mmetsp:Transcript_9707/g.34126  ORF Transcript_9707/g.34126 Transcript_9707/m.34126 type:complete len:252 (+) Transcript_9707:1922-2677(+)